MGWIAVTFGSDVHVLQRMNSNDFGDPLTFPVVSKFSLVRYLYIYVVDWYKTLWRDVKTFEFSRG